MPYFFQAWIEDILFTFTNCLGVLLTWNYFKFIWLTWGFLDQWVLWVWGANLRVNCGYSPGEIFTFHIGSSSGDVSFLAVSLDEAGCENFLVLCLIYGTVLESFGFGFMWGSPIKLPTLAKPLAKFCFLCNIFTRLSNWNSRALGMGKASEKPVASENVYLSRFLVLLYMWVLKIA